MTQPVKPILTSILAFFVLILSPACVATKLSQQEIVKLLNAPQNKFKIVTPGGKEIPLRLALTMEQKTRGLSGLMPEEFSKQEGMFFFY